ncbi:hypothetical protein C2869_10075 [Saccharobesus litoralis]|uniref:Uncharacterized protein n=1 Tax=Saccharobesus litoralis TaxID=2172099 RepID=A0A2S0VRC0_9ALTE|nr:hypothetical protein [Saccharobesus litoralis]AWB66749.1 hypothetical protein C2869_10075 [Saccharobesus litoralis]
MIDGLAGRLEYDIEYGNATSFYSGAKSKTLPYLSEYYSNLRPDGNSKNYEWKGILERTNLVITEDSFLDNANRLFRRVEFEALSESNLFDMVSRFVVYSDCADAALIAGLHYPHKSSNLYYQFENFGSVEVPVSKTKKLIFKSGQSKVPAGFKEVFYIRDEAKTERGYRWIVHHRLIVDPKECQLVLRCCNPRLEGALPFQKMIPNWFKRIFFRIREARYPNFPFMSVGEYILQKHDNAVIETMVEIHGR